MSDPERKVDLTKDFSKNGLNDFSVTKNSFMQSFSKIQNIFDGPATFFRGILEKTRKDYPYYHRKFPRVATVDECEYDDSVCIFEANEQFVRDRKVDKFITQILGERAEEFFMREGHYDGITKCRQLSEDYQTALVNYYVKYGDLRAKATCVDAYMKQKHRLIWQRRHPDVDLYGYSKIQELQKKTEEHLNSYSDEPIH